MHKATREISTQVLMDLIITFDIPTNAKGNAVHLIIPILEFKL